MTDVWHCLLNIRKGPRADHMVHSLTLRGVLDRVRDCACGRLQLLYSRVDVDLAVQGEYRRIKRLDTGQRIHFEYYGLGYFRKCRLTHSAGTETVFGALPRRPSCRRVRHARVHACT